VAGPDSNVTATLHRVQPGAPTPEPIVTAIPVPVATPEPVMTAAPEPVVTAVPVLVVTAVPVPVVTPEPVVTDVPVPVVTPEPAITAAPPSAQLAGVWQADGTDITLTPDGKIEIVQAEVARVGAYTADASTISAALQDGTKQVYRYILMGDTLLLTDEQLGNPLTLTRQAHPQPIQDPVLFGTWGGFDKGEYGELTLTAQGIASMFVPSNPLSPMAGTYSASAGTIVIKIADASIEGTYAVEGDSLKINRQDGESAFVRKSGALTRGTTAEELVAATVDAALVGTWGGEENGVYGEITFSGSGAFSKFVPADEAANAAGTFMASQGSVAVLLPAGAMQGVYAIAGDSLTLTWSGAAPVTFNRQTGPLSRVADAG
jgi:hypothetical protein